MKKKLSSRIILEWHPIKNGDLKPNEVALNSHRKVWWKCEKNHEWEAAISSRNRGSGCPYCSNQKVLKGYNDLLTINPKLAKEWHPTKNNNLYPTDVTSGSTKKVWWRCDKGHEYEAQIYNRKNGRGCPYCSNRKVLKGYNDLLTINPELSREWHPTNNRGLTPSNVTIGSGKKVWWKCEKGHEWEATINSRRRGNRCPYCSNTKVLKGYNDIATIKPELSEEWHPTKNVDLKPSDVTIGSGKKIWWKCEKGHEWRTTIHHRVSGKGCPYCSNTKVLKGYNDLATIKPDLLEEWHPTKNRDLKPTNVTVGSGKKVWWRCNKGHEWEAVIYHRSKGIGCPYCKQEKQTSFPELVIYFYMKNIFEDVINRAKINNTEIDIYIPSLEIGIEYDGYYWHKDKLNKDINKNNKLMKNNINVLRVRERGLEEINTSNGYSYILSNNSTESLKKSIEWIFNKLYMINKITIDQKNKISSIEIDIYKDEVEILNMIEHMVKENSIMLNNIDICMEWNEEKNRDLSPYNFTQGSNKKVWWKCKEGHEWQASVSDRTRGNGCPICSNKKTLKGYNDLSTTHYELSKEWHSTKNGDLLPDRVTYGSGKKVWWKCKEGHEWEASIVNRVRDRNCPICSNKQILKGYNDLSTTHYELSEEWHPTKNGDLLPDSVTYGSGKKVWWKCKEGHEWEAIISSRVKGRGCPICSNQKVLIGYNDLLTKYPELSEEWHPTKNGDLLPDSVTYGSGKKIWWKCKEGHEWEATISSRTKQGTKCPCCVGLYTIKSKNDLLTLEPSIAKEWHPTKNNGLKPEDVKPGSNKKVWWKCKEGHEWICAISHRASKEKTGCPYCYGRYPIKDVNDLKTKFHSIAKEWHPTKNNDLKPEDVKPGSGKKVWWKCSYCSESYERVIRKQVKSNRCPKCKTYIEK